MAALRGAGSTLGFESIGPQDESCWANTTRSRPFFTQARNASVFAPQYAHSALCARARVSYAVALASPVSADDGMARVVCVRGGEMRAR